VAASAADGRSACRRCTRPAPGRRLRSRSPLARGCRP
jgi:hypothetical protein